MKKYVSFLVSFACIFLFTSNVKAQVVQQQADKWQLINGVKLEPGAPIKSLEKTKAATVSTSINSQDIDATAKKKDKVVKPKKALKYGNQKLSNTIRNDDEE
jgi:hypothetical protein